MINEYLKHHRNDSNLLNFSKDIQDLIEGYRYDNTINNDKLWDGIQNISLTHFDVEEYDVDFHSNDYYERDSFFSQLELIYNVIAGMAKTFNINDIHYFIIERYNMEMGYNNPKVSRYYLILGSKKEVSNKIKNVINESAKI